MSRWNGSNLKPSRDPRECRIVVTVDPDETPRGTYYTAYANVSGPSSSWRGKRRVGGEAQARDVRTAVARALRALAANVETNRRDK